VLRAWLAAPVSPGGIALTLVVVGSAVSMAASRPLAVRFLALELDSEGHPTGTAAAVPLSPLFCPDCNRGRIGDATYLSCTGRQEYSMHWGWQNVPFKAILSVAWGLRRGFGCGGIVFERGIVQTVQRYGIYTRRRRDISFQTHEVVVRL